MSTNPVRTLFAITALTALIVLPGAVERATASTDGTADEARTLSILYNGSVRGELIDCGCKSRPLGGLARRAAYVDHLREDHPHVLLLDAGSLFGDPTQDTFAQSRFVAEQTAAMGYSVVGVGPYEIGHGVDAVRRVAASTGLHFVSANLADAAGDLLFEPYRVVEENGVRVAVTSVYDPRLLTAPFVADDAAVRALPPAETLRNWLPELNAEADLVVVLSNLRGSGSVDLLRTLGDAPSQQVDLIIEGVVERQYPNPRSFGDSRILAANARGKYLGQIDLVVRDGEVIDAVNEIHPLDVKLKEDPAMAEAVANFQEATGAVAGGR